MALTDFEAIIRTYMEERLKESYPEIAASGNVLSDLYINPFIEVSKPLIMLINKIDRMQSLYNAKYMTIGELNVIGAGNHGVFRRAGSRASGYVYVEMEPQYVGPEPVMIPIISVANDDKFKFKSRTTTIIKFSEDDVITAIGTVVPGIAIDYLNVSTGKYEFPVYVEAEEAGEEYNVGVNSLTTLLTPYALLTGVVTNKEAFGNGFSMESNEEYVRRIIQEPITRTVGTNAWHKNYILENFPDVCNVYVAGRGHPLMQRDLFVIKGHEGNKEINIGGKTDLYIRGSDIQSYEQTSYIYSDRMRLLNPRLYREDTILCINNTDSTNNNLDIELIYEFPETKTGYIDVKVKAGSGGRLPSPGDEIEVRYNSFLDDTYFDTYLYIQHFYYQSNKIRLLGVPFKSFIAIKNETTDTDVSLDNTFEIERSLPPIETDFCPDQSECTLFEIKLNSISCVAIIDYYKDCDVKITAGTGVGQTRKIISYDAANLVAEIDTQWDAKPDVTSVYTIISYTNKCENSAGDTIDIVCDMDSLVPDTAERNFNNGDKLTLTYTYNKLVADIQEDSDIREIRAICADVLVREAIPEYVYMGLKVKCKYGRLLTTEQKLIIQAVIEDILVATDFDSELQMSDIISTLYRTPEVDAFMDYIAMPPVFFNSAGVIVYSDEELIALTGEEHCKSNIIFSPASYPELAKCVIVDV